jgi:PAS domain S-box-containing protein
MANDDDPRARVIVLSEDTDLHRAAEDLRLSREQLDEAQQIARLGSWEYDFATGRRTWSTQMSRLYGNPAGTPFDLDAFFRRIHPDDLQRMRELMVRTHATKQPIHDHYRIVHDDGSVHTLQLRVRFVVDESGAVTRSIGVVQDITERAAGEEELRRRAVQQAAVANLGQMGLTHTSLASLQWQAVAFVRDVLDADFSHLLQHAGDHFVLVEGAGWDESAVGTMKVALDGTPAGQAFASGSTVLVDDLENDDRFPAKDFLTSAGAQTGVITPIASGGDVEPWGVLAAYSRTRRIFDNNDTNFIRSIATVLAQAIERHRADAELRIRATQQSAIAELGRGALSSLAEETFERACELVATGLGVEYAVFCDLDAEGCVIRHRAGRGNAVFPRELPVAADTQSGLAVLLREPVIVEDYRRETRFRTAREAADVGMISGVAVPVASGPRVYGILAAHSATAHTFTSADVHFIESLANILAEAIERENRRRALVDSEERYRSVVEGASEIIFGVEPDGRIASLNPAFETITGWKSADWIGRQFSDLVEEADRERVEGLFAEMQSTGSQMTTECAITGRERRVLLELNAFSRMRDGAVIGMYGFARDVTEERSAETERRKLELKLEQANRLSSLGRLAATVAHEFNNVLMGIAPFLDVIRRRPSATAEAVEHIARSVTRGKRISHDILRFTQPAEPVLVPVDVDAWIHRVAQEARSLVGIMHGVEVKLEDPLRLLGDACQLHQIFINLILNARDSMPDGGVVVIGARSEDAEARFDFGHVEHPDRFVHFTVTDTGIGMSPETLRHAFEPLFTTKKSGTGLGLAVTHQVVQQHGGEIFIESVAGAGTTFHVFIPMATDLPPAKATPPRVLIVEDDETVATGLACLLELDGMIADVVTSGAEAIESVRTARPTVVLLDVGLPDMHGRKVYGQLAELHPDLPVVFSTGDGDRGSLVDLLQQPHVACLVKPYDVDSLRAALARVLQ